MTPDACSSTPLTNENVIATAIGLVFDDHTRRPCDVRGRARRERDGGADVMWLIYDEPTCGGDGTFLTASDGDDLWSHDRERAWLMTHDEARVALDDVDCGVLLRHRLAIVPASRFGLGRRLRRAPA